mgnify:CR=1 FL=1
MNRTDQLRQWVQTGIDSGFCSQTWCETHEAPILAELLTEAEAVRWEDGDDGCVHVLRLYETTEDDNHANLVQMALADHDTVEEAANG